MALVYRAFQNWGKDHNLDCGSWLQLNKYFFLPDYLLLAHTFIDNGFSCWKSRKPSEEQWGVAPTACCIVCCWTYELCDAVPHRKELPFWALRGNLDFSTCWNGKYCNLWSLYFFIVFIKSCITSKHIFSNSIITEYFCDVVSDNHALAFAETTPLVPFSSTKQYRVFWLIVLNLDDMTSLLFWFLLCSQSAVLGQSTPLFSATNWPVQTSSFSSLRERIWQENSLIMYQE